MKEVTRVECGQCGRLFLPEQATEAEKHEKACKSVGIVAKELVIGYPDKPGYKIPNWKYVEKNTVLDWIKKQKHGHIGWVERVYSNSPDGADLMVAFWKEKIVGMLMYEHAWMPTELESYNRLEAILVNEEEEKPIRDAVKNKLREIYEEDIVKSWD